VQKKKSLKYLLKIVFLNIVKFNTNTMNSTCLFLKSNIFLV